MVEFSDLFESEEEGFVKKAKVGIARHFAWAQSFFEYHRSAVEIIVPKEADC